MSHAGLFKDKVSVMTLRWLSNMDKEPYGLGEIAVCSSG
jgi:hypothetical protein